MKIFLIGFMGSGKSTVGPIVASKLDIPFVDADHFLETKAGETISHIFQVKGEPFFRELETACLKEISQLGSCVVATGGGLVEREENCSIMKNAGKIIFLKADAENVYKATANNSDRPLLKVDDPFAFIQNKINYRNPMYQKWADFTVTAHTSSPDEIAQNIVDYLKTSC